MAAVLSITLARLPSRQALRWKSAPFPRASTAASSSVTASAVARLVQCVPDVLEQRIGDGRRGFGQAGMRDRAGRRPARTGWPARRLGAASRCGGRDSRARPPAARLGFHQCPGQRGDQRRVVGVQAHVGDAYLSRRIVLGQPGSKYTIPVSSNVPVLTICRTVCR